MADEELTILGHLLDLVDLVVAVLSVLITSVLQTAVEVEHNHRNQVFLVLMDTDHPDAQHPLTGIRVAMVVVLVDKMVVLTKCLKLSYLQLIPDSQVHSWVQPKAIHIIDLGVAAEEAKNMAPHQTFLVPVHQEEEKVQMEAPGVVDLAHVLLGWYNGR